MFIQLCAICDYRLAGGMASNRAAVICHHSSVRAPTRKEAPRLGSLFYPIMRNGLLHRDCQVHVRVYRAGDLIGASSREDDIFRLAWLDSKPIAHHFLGTLGGLITNLIFAEADDMQAAIAVVEMHRLTGLDRDAMLDKVVACHLDSASRR